MRSGKLRGVAEPQGATSASGKTDDCVLDQVPDAIGASVLCI
jgi:hypothetical protein